MRSLPDPSEPLQRDGVHIAPSRRNVDTRTIVEVPKHSEVHSLVTSTRRKLVDLPGLPREINAFAAVLVYTASGIKDDEIAVATGFTREQLLSIRQQPAYTALEANVIEAVRQQSTADAAAILAQGEIKAAEKVVELVDSEDHKVALRASQDVLDRRGHRPVDMQAMRDGMRGQLNIVLVDKRAGSALPVIDMEPG